LKAVNKVRNRSTSFYAGHELENKVFQAFPVIQLQAGEEFARFFYSKARPTHPDEGHSQWE
jgi:hypothetical protein